MQIRHLNDQRPEAVVAPLRVSFAASKVCRLTARDGNALAVAGAHPAPAVEREEQLAEAGDMRTDLAAGIDLNEMDMR